MDKENNEDTVDEKREPITDLCLKNLFCENIRVVWFMKVSRYEETQRGRWLGDGISTLI